ncbi:MAG: N-acetylneuraminate synthase family protein [Nitrospirae bacterium]|nr:N-acetylneuraminate synthase family protein [Nitrospirota bacterium]MBF0533470.1 N-acetylneuraminate synthase family protein [Nitrospirota bacterium]MBF0616006.1 N-acetylneuraminate synthase family protein [Nitrospirota bacterium]
MESKNLFSNLFIFEMANNHMGDVQHGLRVIREFHNVCSGFKEFNFAFKFQYRDIETFIHNDYKNRTDIKYVKRFLETNISASEKKLLKTEAEKLGFITICTPFDENSVDLIEDHGFSIIKIASCSFTDWPLLEKIAKKDKPIIASTASASLEDIDQVVLFFEHREKTLCLMHCVGEYPTAESNLQLNQIDLLKRRYPDLTVGFSTHESPDNTDSIKIAIAKGAKVFERHVALKTEKYDINAYSSTPEQIQAWLKSASSAFAMCGGVSVERFAGSDKEKADLRGLQRGVFAKTTIEAGQCIDTSNTFYAIPNLENQIVANDMSKYIEFIAIKNIKAGEPVTLPDVSTKNFRADVLAIINKLKPLLTESKIALSDKLEMELSHHYGIERFSEWGAAIINCINREYCKKIIILLPGQKHPVHFHKKKEETFHVLYGSVTVNLGGIEKTYKCGDIVVVEREVKHNFSSEDGAIFEEISTTHYKDDSFYDDEKIAKNRKTAMTFWADWLYKPIF